jgi:hypothetical protein
VTGVCPKYPDVPETTLQTLEEAAKRDPETGRWIIEQSKLAEKLDVCARERAMGQMLLAPRK